MRRAPPSSSRRSRPAPRAASSATGRNGLALALTLRSVPQRLVALLARRPVGILGSMALRTLGRYLARHRGRYAAGVLLLVATNACALLIPWVTKDVIDSLGVASGHATRQTVTAGALLVVGLALVQAVTRTTSRLVLLGAG